MRVGVLGGGQLARMLALAGAPLGIRCGFRDIAPDACATPVARAFTGDWDDETVNAAFLQWADVFTWEFEHIPSPLVERVAATGRLRPAARALEIKRDRAREKRFFDELGIPTAAWHTVDTPEDLERAVARLGGQCVLKRRTWGYDGKGQAVIRGDSTVARAWRAIDGKPAIVESLIPFVRELSVVVARTADGVCTAFPLAENVHRGGILVESRPGVPGPVEQGVELARRLAEALDYVGVLALELFECADGRLLVNEFAPRVHNSGHWSIDLCETSQFEQHLRAICDLPMGDTSLIEPGVMLNLIGTVPEIRGVLAVDGAHLHLYGKAERPGRKVGHVTIAAPDPEILKARLQQLDPLVAAARVLAM